MTSVQIRWYFSTVGTIYSIRGRNVPLTTLHISHNHPHSKQASGEISAWVFSSVQFTHLVAQTRYKNNYFIRRACVAGSIKLQRQSPFSSLTCAWPINMSIHLHCQSRQYVTYWLCWHRSWYYVRFGYAGLGCVRSAFTSLGFHDVAPNMMGISAYRFDMRYTRRRRPIHCRHCPFTYHIILWGKFGASVGLVFVSAYLTRKHSKQDGQNTNNVVKPLLQWKISTTYSEYVSIALGIQHAACEVLSAPV
jgi:hypothetical protein